MFLKLYKKNFILEKSQDPFKNLPEKVFVRINQKSTSTG